MLIPVHLVEVSLWSWVRLSWRLALSVKERNCVFIHLLVHHSVVASGKDVPKGGGKGQKAVKG